MCIYESERVGDGRECETMKVGGGSEMFLHDTFEENGKEGPC